jgi:hypothetical protein
MSHPDPCYDPDNSYDEDSMASNFTDYHYDYHDDFYSDDSDHDDDDRDDCYDDSMDGDHDSAMTSCGWGTDEDYGYFGENDDDSFYGEDY